MILHYVYELGRVVLVPRQALNEYLVGLLSLHELLQEDAIGETQG
jgi:hypothetical protein